ncbi:MAG: hypothetical protein ACYDDN_03845 [Candidatus Desulforudaceae bacterium]
MRLPVRGGNWTNASNAGLFSLNLNNDRSNVNTNIGFRAASPCSQKGSAHGLASSAQV